MESQRKYVTYVNAYYAVQEALDSRRRNGDEEPVGLSAFCRRANPFLWDEEASADRTIYESFSRDFRGRFDADDSSPDDAYDFVRDWLKSLEGDEFGTLLLDAFDSVADRRAFVGSFDAVRKQLDLRRIVNELMPQDRPATPPSEPSEPSQPSGAFLATAGEIPAILDVLAPDDVAQRDALAGYLRAQIPSGALHQWVYLEEGAVVATAGIIPVALPPEGDGVQSIGLLRLCAGPDERLDALLSAMRAQEDVEEIHA